MDAKVNRWWVFCTAGAGLLLVALAIVADLWWHSDNVVPSALLELGASALMAAVLFFVVPHFTGRVAEAVMDQMTASGASRAPASANGIEGDDERVSWEATFVRALDDIDADQLRLLERFTQSAEQLRLAPKGRGDHPLEALDEDQLKRISGDVPDLPAALAALQGHGLLATRVLGGGVGGGTTHWVITSFGTRFVERLHQIGEVLASPRPPS